MNLNEIAEYVTKNYPDSCIAYNGYDDWTLLDDLMEFFNCELMDMCGCGNPDDTYEVIRRVLNIRHDRCSNIINYDEARQRYKDDLHLDPDDDIQYGALQFILYKLDSCGIVEHGSSISGCWLTELGEMYLTVLNEWHKSKKND